MNKSSFKQTAQACVLTAFIGVYPSAHAGGIPVIDGAHIGTSVANEVQNIVQYVATVNELIDQYNQMVITYKSTTGSRGFEKVLNNPMTRAFLPQDWASLYTTEMVALGCVKLKEVGALSRCNSVAKSNVDNRIMAITQVKIAQRRRDIQMLIDLLARTTDPKDVQDLTARIDGERANLANEQAELDAYREFAATQSTRNKLDILVKVSEQTVPAASNWYAGIKPPASAAGK